jgi:hypothetical protein
MVTVIGELWNSSNPAAWEKALQRYWEYVKPSNIELEQSMEKLNANKLSQLDAQGWYEFLRDQYFRWKYTANNRYATTTKHLYWYIEKKALDQLHDILGRLISFDSSDIAYGLKTAQEIRGLGCAGASGLLSLLYPRSFGTVDQFAVKALREVHELPEATNLQQMNEMSLTTKDGVVLINIMQRKATQLNTLFNSTEWTPRKIDMILWTYGRQSDLHKGYDSAQRIIAPPLALVDTDEVSSKTVPMVEAKVNGLGDFYSNGKERFEIHIAKSNAEYLRHTIGSPMPILLQIGAVVYNGVLRSTVKNKYLWISATVYDHDGNRKTLEDVLSKNGILKNQIILLHYTSGKICIVTAV